MRQISGFFGGIFLGVICFNGVFAEQVAGPPFFTVDALQFLDFIESEVFDIQDLVEGAEIQRRSFNRMTPPGVSLEQPMSPSVVPFDDENFGDDFLGNLIGEDLHGVAVYPLALELDPQTRETSIYNADGDLFATHLDENSSRIWPEDSDPARIILTVDLLPIEDVGPFLFAQERLTAKIQEDPIILRSLASTEFGFSSIQHLTNGNTRLIVTNGTTDAAEIFVYTMWHTSSIVVVVWTNDYDEVSTNDVTLWDSIAPNYNGRDSTWEYGTANLPLTGGVGIWEDTNISTNARNRFYAASKLCDSDADGITDGTEVFLLHTNPENPDTDGDGHSDGRELVLGTDPLDGNDFFGIIINAALPIPPPPGSEVGREWIELFNAGRGAKSLAGFRLQTALTAGWSNVFTFPAGVTLDSGDFLVIGNSTNGDFSANLFLPNSSYTPPSVFGIRLVTPAPDFYVVDALFYGFTNDFGFSLDGFGEELPILRPKTNQVIRRTWLGYDSDHAGDWKNVLAAQWPPHRQGMHLDLDGDGLSNADEIAGGIFPLAGGTRIDEADSDGDGISDADERLFGTNPNLVDSDRDAFPWSEEFPPRGSDFDELAHGTNPLRADCDSDGIPDGWELAGGLNPLSPDSNGDAMPDGVEDSDGDGIPNAIEVGNLTNLFDAEDVDPRPYLWNGQDPDGGCDLGDMGYGVRAGYFVQTSSHRQPILVQIIEGGYVDEAFDVECSVEMFRLDPEGSHRNRLYCIVPGESTNFVFTVVDGKTTWENENPAEYGADIQFTHKPTSLDLEADVSDESEETVGILLADKSAHPEALRQSLRIVSTSGGQYLTHVILTYDTGHLTIYNSASGGEIISSGTHFPVEDDFPELFVEGKHWSGMQAATVMAMGTLIPAHDQVNVTVLKADIGPPPLLAARSVHPTAPRQPLLLKQTLPSAWNGLMQLSLSGATAYWTPTGGVPIALSETVFTNAQLPKIIYLEGNDCGTGAATFSVVGLPDCTTNIPLQIFGVNATLAGVIEAEEETPGGFIPDHTVHTNAPRTPLTLEACGPSNAPGNLILTWNSSILQIYPTPTSTTPLTQFAPAFSNFTGTTLYLEGIAPVATSLQWQYSELSDCADEIRVTVCRVSISPSSMTAVESLDSATFTCMVTPSNLAPKFQWLSGSVNGAWPSTAGNHPVLDYSAPTLSSTLIHSTRWYAPTPSRRQVVDGVSCQYVINCDANIGGNIIRAYNPATLIVRVNMTGQTTRPTFRNWNSIAVAQTSGVWVVTGIGDFFRSVPAASVNTLPTSQFYSKAMVHESKHASQWSSELPWRDLFDAQDLFNALLSGLTSTVSEDDLRTQIDEIVLAKRSADAQIANQTVCEHEEEAFNAMNAVSPDFLELDPVDWEPLYNCP